MLTKIKQNEQIIGYLSRNRYENLNILGYLNYNKNANVYLYDENVENGVFVCDENFSVFYANANNEDFAKIFLEQLPKTPKRFSGVPMKTAEFLTKNRKVERPVPCGVYILKEVSEKPANYTIEPLTLADAEVVDSYYTYRSENSLADMRENIELYDSAGIRVNGELVSWCLIHARDGSAGPIFTKPEYEKQGMGKAISLYLFDKLLKKNITPYIHIVENNQKAISLARSLGFEHITDCLWFTIAV
ncbi:MAG: GNAT family N-acetyltransferase [Turicibacter sp.]|nr:GNAT family N-acetyltransferase [Turicibacter sp.]